jgi:hypothetical protein
MILLLTTTDDGSFDNRATPEGMSSESPELIVKVPGSAQKKMVQVPPWLVHHDWLTVYGVTAWTAGTPPSTDTAPRARREIATEVQTDVDAFVERRK